MMEEINVGNSKFTIVFIAKLSLFLLCTTTGCSTINRKPIMINSTVGNIKSNNTNNISVISHNIKIANKITLKGIQKTHSFITLHSNTRDTPQSKDYLDLSKKKFTPTQQVQMKNGFLIYKRKYKNIPKGSYEGSCIYNVKYGDTLYYIAWITGNDFHHLAQQNNIFPPYSIHVGQKLQVKNLEDTFSFYSKRSDSVNRINGSLNKMRYFIKKNNAAVSSQLSITHPKILYKKKKKDKSSSGVPMIGSIFSAEKSILSTSKISAWRWPTNGKVIENFFSLGKGNKGIDIAGSKRQAVVATADGYVVYVGNALRGYGNLIIIKHNNDYLSAYAHNDTMLVRERQKVKAGQKIAVMGSSGTNSIRLHFEIRYKGKSVNPLYYLPQR